MQRRFRELVDSEAAVALSSQRDEFASEAALARPDTMRTLPSVAALVGLAFEARIAAATGILVLCRAALEDETSRSLVDAARNGCRGIISFGVAGGLDPDLRPGDCIVASSIIDRCASWPTNTPWSDRLLQLVPDAVHGKIVGVDTVVPDPQAKRELYERTGAVAVDMESHLVARFAAVHGLPCATLRVVIDPVHRKLPAAAVAAIRPGGCTDFGFLLRELAWHPSQALGLLRLASDACVAHYALTRLARVLEPFCDFRTVNAASHQPYSEACQRPR